MTDRPDPTQAEDEARRNAALHALWRDAAEKRIEGADWPRIVLDLFRDLDAVERERDRLRAWKAEALPLFDGLQDLGRALDLPLGVLITGPRAIEAATALRAERDAARAALGEPAVDGGLLCDTCTLNAGRPVLATDCLLLEGESDHG